MRRAAALAVALVAGLGLAAADDDSWDDENMAELEPVTARARRVGRSIVVDARFELDIRGPMAPPGEARTISLPHDAVITAATVQVGAVSRTLKLVSVADADKQLEALFEQPGPRGERMSAVRIDAGSDTVTVQIAVPRRDRIRLALALEVPGCFANDTRNIIVPRSWERVLAGGTAITGAAATMLDEQCGEASDVNPWFAFPDHEVARQPAGARRVAMHSARLALAGVVGSGPGTDHLARVEILLAKHLTEIPADLHTVLVVDHSRSVTQEELEVQRAVVAGYLRAAPRTRVQLVGYTRDARTLLPGWMIAAHAGARIDRELRALSPHNGSNIDRGLGAAATLLANAGGTRRIVLFTDDNIPTRIIDAVDSYAPSLPAGTLVHVVSLTGGFDQRLVRSDVHPLLAIAAATGGVAMRAELDDSSGIDALPLARPISFDNVEITSPGWSAIDSGLECPGDDRFVEGSSCAWLAEGTAAAGPITIEGWLWGTKVTRVITPDLGEARALARLLIHHDRLPGMLSEGVHRAAMAVSSVWSLVATWGTGGYGDQSLWGTIGTSRFGTISGHHIDHIDIGRNIARKPTEELLAQLGPAVRACKPHGRVVGDFELTHEEIVDVELAMRDVRDNGLRDCIAERMWDTTLVIADAPPRVSVHVEFQP